MHYSKHHTINTLHIEFDKVCSHLHNLIQAKQTTSSRLKPLEKSYHKCLKKLGKLTMQLTKAGGAVTCAMLLSTQIHAQKCNQFINANAANQLKFTGSVGKGQAPFFVDIDNDGDYDCYIQSSYFDRKPILFRNVGTNQVPRFVKDTSDGFQGFVDPDPYASNGDGPEFADVDGDGDYDCFIGEGYDSPAFGGGYHILYYENTGTKTNPHFVENEAKNPFAFVAGSYTLKFSVADIDGDGDYDFYYEDLYTSATYKNVGTKTKPSFKSVGFSFSGGGFSHRTYYDWNKDGLIDYFQNGDYYRNTGPAAGSYNYVKDDDNGPTFSFDPFYLQTFVDLNNDGVPEAWDRDVNYNTLTPVPVIKAAAVNNTVTVLKATPQSDQYKYRWQRDGKNIPKAFAPFLPVTTPGYYTVEITDSCGTGVSLPRLLQPSANIGAVDFAAATEINNGIVLKAYPNPFTQQFMLALGNTGTNKTVRITDVLGRVISIIKTNKNTETLGSNLQKGVYIVQVLQNDTVLFSQKIIKE